MTLGEGDKISFLDRLRAGDMIVTVVALRNENFKDNFTAITARRMREPSIRFDHTGQGSCETLAGDFGLCASLEVGFRNDLDPHLAHASFDGFVEFSLLGVQFFSPSATGHL